MTSVRLNRRRRFEDHRPRWSDIPEEPDEDPDYDRDSMMIAVDMLDRGWRDLVNEHGFTAVVKVWRETANLDLARRMLQARHEMRQQQLAQGSF